MKPKVHPVVVIGGGPAGIGAVLQLRVLGVDFIWIERNQLGGLLNHASEVRNYPGVPPGLRGSELVRRFRATLRHAAIAPIHDEVLSVRQERGCLAVSTPRQSYACLRVICASGTLPRPPPVELAPPVRKLVIFDPGTLMRTRHRNVCVVGAGDLAFDFSVSLARRHRVTLLSRSATPTCTDRLLEQASGLANIRIMRNARVSGIDMDGGVIRVTHERGFLVADHVLFAIGRQPNLDILERGLRESPPPGTAPSPVLLAGDVHNGLLRQAAIAAGDGVKAAMKVYHSMRERK